MIMYRNYDGQICDNCFCSRVVNIHIFITKLCVGQHDHMHIPIQFKGETVTLSAVLVAYSAIRVCPAFRVLSEALALL